MPGSDAEGTEWLWCEKGGRWAGVREGSASLAWPLLCQWVISVDLMQDRGPVPVHGLGALKAGPVALALPCPRKDGKRLDGSSGNGWRCVGQLGGERSNSSSLERSWGIG